MQSVPDDKPCPHCGRFNNRGLSIEAVVVRGDKILLGKRGNEPFKGCWSIFGGFVEWDETLEEALRRETQEESGLKVTSAKFIGVYSDPGRHPKQVVTAAYSVETEGEPRAGSDIDEVGWYEFSKLPKLYFDHMKIIEDYLKMNS